MATKTQIARIQADYSKIAGEKISIQMIGGSLYIFGSEVATLRLFRKMPNQKQGFSENMDSFYFSYESEEKKQESALV